MKPESRPGSNFIFLAHTIAAGTLGARYYFSFWWKEHVLHSTSQIRLPFSHSMRARWANASLVCCTYFFFLAAEARPASIFRLVRHSGANIEPWLCVFFSLSVQAHLTLSWRRRSRCCFFAFAGKQHHDSWFHVQALFCIIFAAGVNSWWENDPRFNYEPDYMP